MEKCNQKPKLILQSALVVLLASLAQNGQAVLADSEVTNPTNSSTNKVSETISNTEENQATHFVDNANSRMGEAESIEASLPTENQESEMINQDQLPEKSLIEQAKDVHDGKYQTGEVEKLDGRGVLIASVDSGVDPSHEALRLDDDITEESLKIKKQDGGINQKIPYVFDFMSGDDSILDAETEHGMHIAGVLVGNSKKGFKGFAPNAQLLAYRTWSKDNTEGYQENNQFFAMEDAIKKGADVISLSIGELGTGRKDDLWAEVIRNARKKNVIIAASMANYGTSSMTNSFDNLVDEKFPQTDTSTTLSVSSNPYVIGVGSYYDTHVYLPHLKVGQLDVAYENVNWNNYFLFKQKESQEISFEDEIIDLEDNPKQTHLTGKVVLVRRTQDDIFPKLYQLMTQGAKGIILINAPGTYTYGNYKNLPEVRSTLLLDKEKRFERTWAISLSETDGNKLKDYLKTQKNPLQKLHFKTNPVLTKVYDHPGISGFSTWGTTSSLELKPDLVAPGENVYSTGNDNSYFNDSGTSMAAPHAAGASALLLPLTKTYHKTWEKNFKKIDLAQLNKLILQNTASVLKDYTVPEGKPILAYSPRRQGAGAINLDKAMRTKVFISSEDNRGVLNLKDFSSKEKTFNIVIRNLSDKNQQFAIKPDSVLGKISYKNQRRHYDKTLDITSVHSRAIKGANLQLADHISIAPHSEMVIPVTLNVGQAELHEFIEGFIYFKSLDKNQSDLSIPFLGFYGDWNRERIVDPVSWQEGSKTKMTGIVTGYPLGEDKFDFVPWGVDYDKWKADHNHLESDQRYYVMQAKGGIASHAKMKIRLMFMRHAKDYQVDIVDSTKTKSLKTIKTGHYPPKFMESAFREYPDRYGLMFGEYDFDLEWDGSLYNPKDKSRHFIAEGNYFIKVKARLDETRDWQETYIPFTVDNIKPNLEVKAKSDKHYAFAINDPHLKEVVIYKDNTEYQKLEKAKDGLYHFDIAELGKKDLEVRAIDFGDNLTIYDFEKDNIVSEERTFFGHKEMRHKPFKRLASQHGFSLYSEKGDEEELEEWEEDELENDETTELNDGEVTDDDQDDSDNQEDNLDDDSEEDDDQDDSDDQEDNLDDESEDDEKVKSDNDPDHFESGSDFNDAKFTSTYVEGNNSSDISDEDETTGQHYRTYFIHLKEGQRLVITNTNALYNHKQQKDYTAKTFQKTFVYDAKAYEDSFYQKIVIPIYQGSNIINVKTYNREKVIFNQGYAVKLDTEAPRLSFENKNISFKTANWLDSEDYDDEVIGTITIPSNKLQLKGSIRDALDGWKLFVNENMIDSNFRIGEYDDYFHQNQKEWFYEKTVSDGEFVKIEVHDHLKNTRTYLFQVAIDPKASVEELVPTVEATENEETSHLVLSDHLEVTEQFKNLDLSQIKTSEELIKALGADFPDYSIQVLKFEDQEVVLRIQKDGAYQLLSLKPSQLKEMLTESANLVIDEQAIHHEKDWLDNAKQPVTHQKVRSQVLSPAQLSQTSMSNGKSEEKISYQLSVKEVSPVKESDKQRENTDDKGNAKTTSLPNTGQKSSLKTIILASLSLLSALLLSVKKKNGGLN